MKRYQEPITPDDTLFRNKIPAKTFLRRSAVCQARKTDAHVGSRMNEVSQDKRLIHFSFG